MTSPDPSTSSRSSDVVKVTPGRVSSALTVVRVAVGVAVVVAATLAARRVPTHVVTETVRRDPVYAGMVGQWQGTVEVRDSADTHHRVKMPARVRVQPMPKDDALEMQFTTRTESGTEHLDTDRLLLDKALTAAQWGDANDSTPQKFEVLVHDHHPSRALLRLVMEGEKSVDEIPATVRQTVTITPGEIHIVQETRRFGKEFEFDREYVLRRVG